MTTRVLSFVVVASVVGVASLPSHCRAQYNCAVTIDLQGKAILQGQIRDAARPPTAQLWQAVATLAFSPTAEGKGLPDLKTLKGAIRVRVDGAGLVELMELKLVPNKLNSATLVIAPDDMKRILELRKASD